MSILSKVEQNLKMALKAKDKLLVSTLKFLLAQIRNKEIELRGTEKKLTDEMVMGVIRQEIKKRKEAAILYRQGKREDLAEKEEDEFQILSKYLPQAFSAEKLAKIVQETIEQVKAKGPADFGKVMGAVMAKIKGQAEGSQVAEVVRKTLT
jgi:hypothetical protein